jgi:hypothetical protein
MDDLCDSSSLQNRERENINVVKYLACHPSSKKEKFFVSFKGNPLEGGDNIRNTTVNRILLA